MRTTDPALTGDFSFAVARNVMSNASLENSHDMCGTDMTRQTRVPLISSLW
ncbi:hypothetical protein HSB1_29120 [Halogranum salarium B-1]|uniref:Uncharacterized protein n=1 Tax=Halogranum salarium B-1 TaxID=1210908 RepID=J3JEK2_9EURY|nr:hypothetical protein HSB1_29120 [Halogranum salarium B-1]